MRPWLGWRVSFPPPSPFQQLEYGLVLMGFFSSIFGLAAVDTGRPTRIAFTSRLSLDFWTGSGALSLDDNWVEAGRPEMGGRASLV